MTGDPGTRRGVDDPVESGKQRNGAHDLEKRRGAQVL